jgi:UTP-glucose-1-phosphate uridylyltransferase
MLPIIDRPLMQYAVDEAVEAGATRVLSSSPTAASAIEDRFDNDLVLEQALDKSGKHELLATVRTILPDGIPVFMCVRVNRSVWVTRFCVRVQPLARSPLWCICQTT